MKASQTLLRVKKRVENVEEVYLASPEFKAVALSSLFEFIKRVKRGLMPSLGKIADLGDKYKEIRKKNSGNLGQQTRPGTSNATATGQMLDAMDYEMRPTGFKLFVKPTKRGKDISGYPSKLTNSEVAGYYSIRRKIFAFSKPELERIRRTIRRDLLKLLR